MTRRKQPMTKSLALCCVMEPREYHYPMGVDLERHRRPIENEVDGDVLRCRWCGQAIRYTNNMWRKTELGDGDVVREVGSGGVGDPEGDVHRSGSAT